MGSKSLLIINQVTFYTSPRPSNNNLACEQLNEWLSTSVCFLVFFFFESVENYMNVKKYNERKSIKRMDVW